MYRSETYVQNLLKGLRDLKERNVACDLTLASKDGASYPVHRIVMAAASSYFMLKMDHEISSGQVHVLRNVDASYLEPLVNFAYTGEMDFSNIPKTAIWPLLAACTELQMTDALNLCHDYLAGNLTPQKSNKASSGRTVQSSSHSGLSIKMEVEAHNVKQEGDYDQGYDDDDNYPAADDTYYTGDNYTPGDGSPVVQLTALEDDPALREQYSEQLSHSPPKRKRGRPRKSDTVEPTPKRGRSSKQKATPKSVVEYSRTPKKGRPRKSASPASTKSKATKSVSKGRPRKRTPVVEKGEKCNSCGKVLKLKSLLAAHHRIKHHRRTYAHDFHRKVESLGIYSKVVVQPDFESNRNVYGCGRCGEVFNMWTRWRKHYMQKHLNSRYTCVKCKIGFSYALDLLHHKHRKHKTKVVLKKRAGIKLQDLSGTSSGRKKGQDWVSMVNLPQAAADEDGEDSKDWQRHRHRSLMTHVSFAAQRFVCGECGRELASENALRKHEETHKFHREMFKCNVCEKKYTHTKSLQEHIQAVHEGKMHKCTICDKEYQTFRAFEEHRRKHTGEYEFKCNICGKQFVSRRIGQEHQNRHYGLKAYECGLCGNKYSDPFVLNRHLRECGEEVYKTHKCPQCDKWFKNEQYVRNHVSRVHRKKKGASSKCLCSECGKVFANKGNLHAHMRDKHQITDFTY